MAGGRLLVIFYCLLLGLVVSALFLQPDPAFAGDDQLAQMTDLVAQKMTQHIGRTIVYFDIKAFKNPITHEIPVLSIYLFNHLQASMSKAGFSLAENTSVAKYLITCDFQVTQKKIDFFFKYYNTQSPEKFQTVNTSLKIKELPDDALTENLDTKALKITSVLLDNPSAYRRIVSGSQRLKVFVNPIIESNYKYQSDFSENFQDLVRSQLIKSDFIEIVEPKPIKVRNRGLMKRQSSKVKDLKSSDALLADADAVMDGKYYLAQNNVTVSLKIRAADGTVLGSAEETLDKNMITLRLDNPEAQKAAVFADIPSQEDTNTLVKITTDKGGSYQTYYEGEIITFMLQVAKPLYVYVYSINSNNEVDPLYPSDGDINVFEPGELYTIPPESADWEIVVTPPFGLDNVVVFACEKKLPLPQFSKKIDSVSFEGNLRAIVVKEKKMELAQSNHINPMDLVEYYRGAALLHNVHLYESNIMITTKAK